MIPETKLDVLFDMLLSLMAEASKNSNLTKTMDFKEIQDWLTRWEQAQ